jgi:hypothetical protein
VSFFGTEEVKFNTWIGHFFGFYRPVGGKKYEIRGVTSD